MRNIDEKGLLESIMQPNCNIFLLTINQTP